MTDRLTDAELGTILATADADRRDRRLPAWRRTQGHHVVALVAELREHRAARTLTDEERVEYEKLKGLAEAGYGVGVSLRFFERITGEDDRG